MPRAPLRLSWLLTISMVAAPILLVSSEASAEAPSWGAVADVRTVFAHTVNENGTARKTKIWLAVLDDQGYVRTSQSTRWGQNVLRTAEIELEIEGVRYALHASFVDDEALRERVVRAFRAKYGWFDGFMQIFRGGDPHIIRLDAQPGSP